MEKHWSKRSANAKQAAVDSAIERVVEIIREHLSKQELKNNFIDEKSKQLEDRAYALGLGLRFNLSMNLRDLQIARAVHMIVEGTPLRPTRSHTVRRVRCHSACSIVHAALARLGVHISERSIEGIWYRRCQ